MRGYYNQPNMRAGFVTLLALLSLSIAYAGEGRAILLEGVKNTRDLGGLQTVDGRSVRTGQLVRSGEIDHLTDEGKAYLDDMGVGAIVDIRTTEEATANPAKWPEGEGPERYNFPLMERESDLIDGMRVSIKTGAATETESDALFFDAFAYIPTDYTSEIRELFDVLLENPEGEAVLYHCSGGKDRTGVVSVLVLTALGVTSEDIEADFMMSNTLNDADNAAAQIAASVNAKQGTDMPAAAVWPSVGVRKEYLENFYDAVESNYGSVEAYLAVGLGLTDADIETLRDRYLE